MSSNIIKEKSYIFALKVISFVRMLPKSQECLIVGKQLFRSGTSIGANVEEAIGAVSRRDFANKMAIALKEAREVNYWLRLIKDSHIQDTNDVDSLITDSIELRRILTSIVKSCRKK
jgi:four helix bundle protein